MMQSELNEEVKVFGGVDSSQIFIFVKATKYNRFLQVTLYLQLFTNNSITLT